MKSSLVGGILLGLCALAIGQGSYYGIGDYDGKIICYVENTGASFSRYGSESQFLPYDLDPSLCTHGIYGFAGISEDFHVFATSQSVDLPPTDSGKFDGYRKFVALKSKSFKAILGVGGGNDDRFAERFSRMAAKKESRDTFICWLIEFATKYGFDGVNIDWHDPEKGDKDNFVTFLREAKSEFDKKGLSLSISASGNVFVAMDGYDLQKIAKHVEFITIRGYDLHDCNDDYTHHHTALGSYPGCKGDDAKLYVEHSMRHFAHNVDPEDTRKIILGIPTYGKTYSLCTEDDGMCAEARCGSAGPFLKQEGTYSYAEICNEHDGDWVQRRDTNQVSPYGVYQTSDKTDPRQWVAFDDDVSINEKCKVARDYFLGGAAVWSVDLDDFKAFCRNGKFYVTNLIRKHCSYWPDPVPITTTTTPGPTDDPITHPVTDPTPDPPPPPSDQKIICYVDNSGGSFARYYTDSHFLPGDLDPRLCTHGIYGFAGITADFHVFATLEEVDLPLKEGGKFDGYRDFVRLKAKSSTFSPILGVGGYDVRFPERFSQMATRKEWRDTFICCLIRYAKKYGFEGVNIDWQDPEAKDKANFVTFLREARAEFDKAGLSLSISASGNVFVAMDGYDLNKIAKQVEFITIRGYDLHDCKDKYTHHHTALGTYDGCQGNDQELYVENAMSLFATSVDLQDRKKIILGIPTYGKTYYLCDDSEGTGMCATAGCGYPGPYLKEEGTYSYAEICDQEKGNWTKKRDAGQVSPYGVYSTSSKKDEFQWVAYDDELSIHEKCLTARDYGLGGAAVWSVDLDDFKAVCGHEKFYVTKLIRKYCSGPGPDPGPSTTTTTTTPPPPPPPDGFTVCYIDHFAADRDGDGKFNPDYLDPTLCEYGIYGFAGIREAKKDVFEPFSHKEETDLGGIGQYDGYRKFVELQAKHPNFKPILGIGGYYNRYQYAEAYSRMAEYENRRATFIANLIDFLNKYGFVGVNIDWYDPGECDRRHLVYLVQEMKKAFDPLRLTISITASAEREELKIGYDLTDLSKEVEFISLRAYNFHNCSEGFVHHHSPYGRYSGSKDEDLLLNAVDAATYAVSEVDDPKKLVLGIPAFGRTYKLCTDTTTIYAEGLCSECVGPYTKTEGLLSYYEICEARNYNGDNWDVKEDPGMVSPYAIYDCPSLFDAERKQWVSYDNENSIEKKCELMKSLDMAGVMVYSVDHDDFSGDSSKWCKNDETFSLLRLIREKCLY